MSILKPQFMTFFLVSWVRILKPYDNESNVSNCSILLAYCEY